MGEVIRVDFKGSGDKRKGYPKSGRHDNAWLWEQERLYSNAMMDRDTPTPDEYYGVTPSDSEPE
jgi:hypothetical protein